MDDSFDLTGRTALVTGAAQGLGAETAKLLLERGANVAVADISQLGNGDGMAGDRSMSIDLDVTKEDQWESAIRTVIERFGGLDILVNNAGVFAPGPIEEAQPSDLERMFQVNQLGTFLGMKVALSALRNSKHAVIINMSSCVALKGTVHQAGYAATKWAVRGLTRCAALEFAPMGIRVNAVLPGPSETSMMETWTPEQSEAIRGMIPAGRFGKPVETAQAVAFLASSAASYISGAELSVDGAVFS